MATYGGPNFNIGETYKNLTDRVKEDNGLLVKPNANDLQQVLSSGLSLNPSLLNYPIGKESSSIYSMVPSDGTGDLICSRNGSATYFDKDGIIRTAAPNEPRLDFDPLTGEFKGILVEEAATNLILRSSILTGGNWYYSNAHQNFSDLFLLNSGRRLVNSISDSINFNASSMVVRYIPFTIFQGLNTISFFCKKTTSHSSVSIWGFISGGSYNINYDVDTFQVTRLQTAPTRFTNRSAFIIPLGNNVFYCYESFISDNNYTLTLGASPTTSGSLSMLAGQELSVAGFQHERSSSPSSYIPTIDSIVTRPADIITLPNYSTLFGERNSRLVTINGENKIYINESNLQLPVGHNKLLLEKQDFFTEQEQTDLSATTATYGVREDIKDELNQVLALNPSLVMIPGKGSAGGLQTLVPNDGTADFTVSRNGTATYLGSDGLLKTAQANEPRLEFNPDGTFKGVLVEPAATNLLLRSEEFENSYWNKVVSPTITPNATTAPDGTLTADEFKFTTSSNSYININISNPTFPDNTQVTISIFVKVKSAVNSTFYIVGFNKASQLSFIFFRLDLKRVDGSLNATGAIQELENGFFRCECTFNTGTGGANLDIRPFAGGAQVTVGDSFFIWGAQLEVGSVATSYIPTVASTVTRPADVIQRTNAQDLIGQTEGSVYFESYIISNLINARIYVALYSGSSNIYGIGVKDNKLTLVYRNNGGILTTNTLGDELQVEDKLKCCFIYTSTNLKVFVNGSLYTNTTYILPYLDSISLTGDRLFYNSLKQHLKSATIFRHVLSDEEAISLTTL